MSDSNQDEIMFPHRVILIKDEEVTIREFSYAESMIAAGMAQNFIRGLTEVMSATSIQFSELDGVVASYPEEWMALLAKSIDKDVDFIMSLNDTDGSSLAMAFWEINGPFLLRRVMFSKILQRSLVTNQ